MIDSKYLEKFRMLVEVCNSTKCELGKFRKLAVEQLTEQGINPATATEQQVSIAMNQVKEQYLLISFLLLAD